MVLLLIVIRSSGSQDLIRGAKDSLCALFWDRVGVVTDALIEPVLQIPATVICSFKTQSFTAQERNGFGFHFTQVPWRLFRVGEIGFKSVADHDVRHLMKKRLVRKLRHRVDRDAALAGKALTVPVDAVEWDHFNAECR